MKTFNAQFIKDVCDMENEEEDSIDDSFLNDPDVKILDDWITKTKNREKDYIETKKGKKNKFVFVKKKKYKVDDFYDPEEMDMEEYCEGKKPNKKKKDNDDKVEEKKKLDKESDDFYEQRFSGSLEMYKNLMGEINSLNKKAKKYLLELMSQNSRNSSRSITDQFSNITTLLNTKMSAIDKINGVNKSISELELKKQREVAKKQEASGENTMSDDYIIDKMFGKLNKENSEKLGVKKNKKRKKKEIDRELDLMFDEENNDEELIFNENEVAFKYEDRNVHIVINRNPNTGRTFFSAIDDEGNDLYDYPLPEKDVIGKVSYNDDFTIGTDKLGNKYDVIPIV